MPTKHHRLASLALLALFLPFLMGNAPAPFPMSELYEDIEVQTTALADDEGGYHRFELSIHNFGETYARVDQNISCNYTPLYQYYGTSVEGRLFANELLIPGQTKTYLLKTQANIEFQIDDVWTTYTYTLRDDGVTFTNPVIQSLGNNEYQLSVAAKGFGDYYYYAMIELMYKGEPYALYAPRNNKWKFTALEELDLSEITIGTITAYRSQYHTYKNTMPAYMVWMLVFVALGLLLMLGLVAGFVLLIVAIVRGNRNKRITH